MDVDVTENQTSLMISDKPVEDREYQDKSVDALMEAILDDDDIHPVVALPTGTGKSVVLCKFVARLLENSPNIKVLVLSHVKEILLQDWDKLDDYLDVPIGLYSAGLGSRTIENITVAGIQSVYKMIDEFEDYDIILIDEAHLVPVKGEGMYRSFLAELYDVNYVGLTATHFRLSHGYIHEGEGALFNKLVFDLTTPEGFSYLIENDWLSNVIVKSTFNAMDTAGIRTVGGDFSQKDMSIVFDRELLTDEIVNEIVNYGKNYKKWMLFAIDIDHAEHIKSALESHKISVCVVHSRMDGDRDDVIQEFKDGKYRAAVSVDMMTTGIDVPDIDLVGLLRPTKSPNIHVQTIGRGMRPFPGKDHCLVLDFAGNTERLGPIDNIVLQKKGKKKKGGDPITKRCPECGVIHAPAVRVCNVCDYHFEFKSHLQVKPSSADILTRTKPEPKKPDSSEGWHDVTDVFYRVHKKFGSPSSLKVTYQCGLYSFNEWVGIDHTGWFKAKADAWCRYRLGYVPENLSELITVVHRLKKPTQIKVSKDKKFANVVDSKF